MCGIFGWLLPSDRQPDRDVLERLTNRLAHRGPDGAGFWTGTTENGGCQIAFGHRRLSIIDIEGGAQPMASSDGKIVLVFNGEVYNYVELRDQLMGIGHVFRTASDSSAPVRTFAVGFDEEKYSELAFARLVAGQMGTNHNEVVVNSENFLDGWSKAIVRRGAPVSETSDIPIFILSKLASKTVKMVLTGEGGDELLGGYPKHRAERAVGLYQSMMPQALHDLVVAPIVRSLPYSLRRAKIFFAAAGERDFTNRMRYWFGGMSTTDRDLIVGQSLSSEPPDRFPFSMNVGSNGRRTMFFDQTSWLPDDLLERGDRMMMAGSIEGRMPFMDTQLARLVARLPDKFLLRGKGGKLVLRMAMKGILSDTILHRKKVGFRVPISGWFQGPYQAFVREQLTGASALTAHIFDRKVVARLVDEHMAARQDHDKILWSLMNLELFLRLFKPAGC